MAPLPALLTAPDLIRAAGAVGLGPVAGPGLDRVQGPGLDRILGLGSDRILGLGLVPAMVPITGRGLDRLPARLALLLVLLHLAAIRLSNTKFLCFPDLFCKSNRGAAPIVFVPRTLVRTLRGTRPVSDSLMTGKGASGSC